MIGSIHPSGLSTATAIVQTGANAAKKADATQARLEAATPGSVTEDPTLGVAVTVDISPYLKATQTFQSGPTQSAQAEDAGRSMETIKKELGKIDSLIAKRRPEIAGSNWDFKLVDGKFKVTGLNSDDAKWLEKNLNSNSALRNAAQSFISTATANLQTSDSNPARLDVSALTGRMENYTFYHVNEQLSGKLSFRALLTQADQVLDSNKLNIPTQNRGRSGLAVAATMLTASNPPIEGRAGPFYAAKYDPLEVVEVGVRSKI